MVGTDGSGSRGAWATPQVADLNQDRGGDEYCARKAGLGLYPNLANDARTWPTPRVEPGTHSVTDGKRYETSVEYVARDWPTPTTRDEKDGACEAQDVETNAMLGRASVRWPTPTSTDSLGSRNSTCPRAEDSRVYIADTLTDAALTFPCSLPAPARGLMREAVGASLSIETLPDGSRCLVKGPTSRRRLNPLFVERLMGWPEGWTAYAPVETASWWSKVRSHLRNYYGGLES